MASTEKKKTGGGTRSASAAAKKTASPSKKTTSGSRANAKGSAKSKAKSASNRRPVRREVTGVSFLLLALCVLVSFFNEDGWLIALLPMLFKGLFGLGYYLTVPALCAAAWILLTHRGRPVVLRTTCTLLQPYVFGVLCHLLFCRLSFTTVEGLIPRLWEAGRELTGGGVLSGMTAEAFRTVLGKSASVVVVMCLLVVLLMVTFELTIPKLIQMWRERERLDYDESDYEEFDQPEIRLAAQKAAAIREKRAQIDIPLESEAPARGEKTSGGFFKPRAKDRLTPADLFEQDEITETTAAPANDPAVVYKLPVEPKNEPQPIMDKPAESAPAEELPELEQPAAEEKRRGKKSAAAEVEQATAQVAAEIESGMAIEDPYLFPPITLLDQNVQENYIEAGAELNTNARRLADTLRSFGVEAAPGDVVRGPAITRYEFMLDQGVKLSKVTNLADDIALALGASGVRIAPIPEKISVVGIEVPNKAVSPVLIRDVIESREFVQQKSTVAFAVGRDIGNKNIIGDIAKLPHVLIAGTTGSGKSVCTNSLIISLLYKSSPEDVRFIMVDPKMVELAPYNGIPHLLIPVVTDPKKAAGALQWAVYEMMKRYKAFSEVGVKKLEEYNALAQQREDLQHMASVVVVIDELADLMLVAAKEVEESICRVAQMGRAAGMHLVIATQRPSADVITGLMKANIPSRIAFAVASSLESRIILDAAGAEKLVGRGDMLYAPLGGGKPQRVQGCFITPEEIERVVSFVKSTGEAQYSDEIIQKIEESLQEKERKGGSSGGAAPAAGGDDDGADELLDAAVEVILETGQASVSMLQRRLKLGYSRAARLVDQMEERGIVGPFEGSKPRQLLISKERWQEMKMASREEEAPPASNYSEHVIPWEDQE